MAACAALPLLPFTLALDDEACYDGAISDWPIATPTDLPWRRSCPDEADSSDGEALISIKKRRTIPVVSLEQHEQVVQEYLIEETTAAPCPPPPSVSPPEDAVMEKDVVSISSDEDDKNKEPIESFVPQSSDFFHFFDNAEFRRRHSDLWELWMSLMNTREQIHRAAERTPSRDDRQLLALYEAPPSQRTRSACSATDEAFGTATTTDNNPEPQEHSSFRYLEEITPPSVPSEEQCNADRYAEETEPLGKYLIKRGFPLLATNGKHSLVFLITDTKVAKVAKYAANTPGKDHLYVKHIQERNHDVSLYNEFPTCFAETRLVFAYEPDLVKHRMYIQERLSDFRGYDINAIQRDVNSFMIATMLIRNRHAKITQWAMTRRKTMKTVTDVNGTEEEFDRQWLVAFDYE